MRSQCPVVVRVLARCSEPRKRPGPELGLELRRLIRAPILLTRMRNGGEPRSIAQNRLVVNLEEADAGCVGRSPTEH